MHFQLGQGPYPVIDANPAAVTCFKAMRADEWGMVALSTLLPAYLGYRANCKGKSLESLVTLRSSYVAVGLVLGAAVGLATSYLRAYSKSRLLS